LLILWNFDHWRAFAFSNLFVQTEFARKSSALLCTRRASSPEEKPPWLLHLMVGQGGELGAISCETDRGKFVGRGGTLANPAAMQSNSPLSNSVGSVLDPIISLRRTVTLTITPAATISLGSVTTEPPSFELPLTLTFNNLTAAGSFQTTSKINLVQANAAL